MSQIFSDYQLVKQLTRKTTSCVYLAQSTKVPFDEVVLKVFDTIRLDGVQEQKNFLQEIHLLQQLHGVLPSHQTILEVNNLILDKRRLQIRWEAHSLSSNASVWHCRPHQ